MPAFSPPKENVGKGTLYTSQSILLCYINTAPKRALFLAKNQ